MSILCTFALTGALTSVLPLPQQLAQEPASGGAAEQPSTVVAWLEGASGEVGLVARRDASLAVFWSDGAGGLADVTVGSGLETLGAVLGVSVADYDGDGASDLLVSTSAGVDVYRGNGGGAFEQRTADFVLSAASRGGWLDVDDDGRVDLLLESEGVTTLHRNEGNGSFAAVALPSTVSFAPAPSVQPAITHTTVVETEAERVTSAPAGSTVVVPTSTTSASGRTALAPTTQPSSQPSGSTAPLSAPPSVTSAQLLAGVTRCADTLDDAAGGGCIQASSAPTLGSLFPLSPELFVDAGGNVGVGTLSPMGDLHVMGSSTESELVVSPSSSIVNGTATVKLGALDDATVNMTMKYDPFAAQMQFAGQFGSFEYGPHMVINQVDGLVGIGTTVPYDRLHVVGSSTMGSVTVSPNASVNQSAELYLAEDDDGTYGMHLRYDGTVNQFHILGESVGTIYGPHMVIERNSGRVGIGTTSPTHQLHVSGDIKAAGLVIDAGADLVEGFETSDGTPSPGTVVVIDENAEGALRTSTDAYDRRVAGVVSGAGGVSHGIRLGQDDLDGETLVAMTGRVYVRCSAENGAIVPGDLLTTAELAGHAMRATDAALSQGAVIGKAMGRLDEGTGLVLVLVNLQ